MIDTFLSTLGLTFLILFLLGLVLPWPIVHKALYEVSTNMRDLSFSLRMFFKRFSKR